MKASIYIKDKGREIIEFEGCASVNNYNDTDDYLGFFVGTIVPYDDEDSHNHEAAISENGFICENIPYEQAEKYSDRLEESEYVEIPDKYYFIPVKDYWAGLGYNEEIGYSDNYIMMTKVFSLIFVPVLFVAIIMRILILTIGVPESIINTITNIEAIARIIVCLLFSCLLLIMGNIR